jgi:hypothetical protein
VVRRNRTESRTTVAATSATIEATSLARSDISI